MQGDLEQLKQQISLLEYLQRHNWTARRVGAREEFAGLCVGCRDNKVRCKERLGGLLKYYHREAA